jgi:hypothetical protein
MILLPWGIFKWQKTGHFELTRPALGINLWEGLGEYPNSCGAASDDQKAEQVMLAHHTQWGTVEGDRVLLNESLDCIRSHPTFYVSTLFRRTLQSFFPHNMVHATFFLIYLFVMPGIYLAYKRSAAELLLLLAIPFSRSIPFTFIHVEDRWIVVGQGALLILAAVALLFLCQPLFRSRTVKGSRRKPSDLENR